MQSPTQFPSRLVCEDTHIIPSYLPAPGLGLLAVNSFLIQSKEPVLIDTGLPALSEAFISVLSRLTDLQELRWIVLTHMDSDHTGSLRALLELAPQARVVTTFLGLAKLSLLGPIESERIYLLNPGQRLWIGDRYLRALKPPVFDAPETVAIFDERSRALFSSDCSGALVSQTYEDANSIPHEELQSGLLLWGTIDAPWIHGIERSAFESALQKWRLLDPKWVLSTHLAPAQELWPALADLLQGLPDAPAFVGPDQEALRKMLSAA